MKFNVSEFLRFLAPAVGMLVVFISQQVLLIFCISKGMEDWFDVVALSYSAGLLTCTGFFLWLVIRPMRIAARMQGQLLAETTSVLASTLFNQMASDAARKKPERVEGDEWKDTQ